MIHVVEMASSRKELIVGGFVYRLNKHASTVEAVSEGSPPMSWETWHFIVELFDGFREDGVDLSAACRSLRLGPELAAHVISRAESGPQARLALENLFLRLQLHQLRLRAVGQTLSIDSLLGRSLFSD